MTMQGHCSSLQVPAMFPYSSIWQKKKSRKGSKVEQSLGGDSQGNTKNFGIISYRVNKILSQ